MKLLDRIRIIESEKNWDNFQELLEEHLKEVQEKSLDNVWNLLCSLSHSYQDEDEQVILKTDIIIDKTTFYRAGKEEE